MRASPAPHFRPQSKDGMYCALFPRPWGPAATRTLLGHRAERLPNPWPSSAVCMGVGASPVHKEKQSLKSLSPCFDAKKERRTHALARSHLLPCDSCGYSMWTSCEILRSKKVICINSNNSSNKNNNSKHLLRAYYAKTLFQLLHWDYCFCHNNPIAHQVGGQLLGGSGKCFLAGRYLDSGYVRPCPPPGNQQQSCSFQRQICKV